MSDLKTNRTDRSQPSFTVANRAKRVLWNIIYIVFIKYSPVMFRKWRIFWYKLFGSKFYGRVNIYPKAIVWAPWNLEMHDRSCIANHVNIYSQSKITVGSRTLISQGAYICSGTHNFESTFFDLVSKPIVICDDVWICAEAFVGPGVTINDGVVLGARSVAFKDLSAWSVFAGNPATKIRDRLGRELWS